jgi:hypothetical protein
MDMVPDAEVVRRAQQEDLNSTIQYQAGVKNRHRNYVEHVLVLLQKRFQARVYGSFCSGCGSCRSDPHAS